jgi:hypothetical protein
MNLKGKKRARFSVTTNSRIITMVEYITYKSTSIS